MFRKSKKDVLLKTAFRLALAIAIFFLLAGEIGAEATVLHPVF